MARILIVDDNADLADNLAEILELAGHRCTTVGSVEAFAREWPRGPWSAVVCDMMLTDGTGCDVVAATRGSDGPPPVVLWTAYADDGRVEEALAAGALTRLRKPCDLERVVEFVERLCDEAAPGAAVCVDDPAQRIAVVDAVLDVTPWRPYVGAAGRRPLASPSGWTTAAVIAVAGAHVPGDVPGARRIELPAAASRYLAEHLSTAVS